MNLHHRARVHLKQGKVLVPIHLNNPAVETKVSHYLGAGTHRIVALLELLLHLFLAAGRQNEEENDGNHHNQNEHEVATAPGAAFGSEEGVGKK
ncbi:hypothetical protein GCM10007359_03480 [Rothia aerolata]|uniref:Uncharacterized protein n=1 Tax=Rothia aerolata TaxID=1812262 RepID=A0A917MQE7_9MICC|nr:hypothetical protein GCM10007359_03480 [Rothia aerolata]